MKKIDNLYLLNLNISFTFIHLYSIIESSTNKLHIHHCILLYINTLQLFMNVTAVSESINEE